MLRRPPTNIRIETGLSPLETLERLRGSAAVVRTILFSPTWGRKEPFVLSIDGSRFAMRARHGYSNGLTRILHGSVRSHESGALIEGQFRTLLSVVLILRGVWIAILIAVAAAWHELPWGKPRDLLYALTVPLFLLTFLVGIEAFARRLGDSDEALMRVHLRSLLGGS